MKFLYKIPGPFLVGMGAFFLSYGGLLVKSFENLSLWQILFWRSLFFTFTVGFFLLFTYKKKTFEIVKNIGLPGVFGGIMISIGFAAYVFAMYVTTVANVNFTITTQTIFLALFGYIFMKEKISKRTLFAIILAMSGVLLMVGDSISKGSYIGNLVSLAMPIALSIMVITVRKFPNIDMVPAMFVAGIFSTIYGAIFSEHFNISSEELILAIRLGITQIGFGFICITIGSKSTPAATVGILMLIEAILGPVWAWIFINEIPPMSVLIGGITIIFAILLQSSENKKTI
tara:strand:- start:114 stop:974 length:861 start_codon:yes stop_codon:yes gene_type:complete